MFFCLLIILAKLDLCSLIQVIFFVSVFNTFTSGLQKLLNMLRILLFYGMESKNLQHPQNWAKIGSLLWTWDSPTLYSSPCQICTGAHNMNRWTNVIRRALRMRLSPECISPKVDSCICYELEVFVYLPTKKWLKLLSLYPIRPYGFK